MLKRIITYIKYRRKVRILRHFSPEMLYEFELNGRVISDTRVGSTTTIIGSAHLTLGENVFIGQYNFIEASNQLTIEEGCQITNFISILTHSSHISIRLYGREYRKSKDLVGYKKGSVTIGKYTFVGPHATIMPSTNIGKGSIVSAYAYVSGDFPDFSIIAGNPAKVIGDTRSLDEAYLKSHPELNEYYRQWAEK